jgi:adenylate kinase family enzyme
MRPAPDAPARIVVVGTSCAGKSTFARELARALGCTRIELDDLHWGPDWQPKPRSEFRRLVNEAVAAQAWVADGNYSAVRDILWPRAEAIVWLNYSFPRVLRQALGRTVHRCLTREPLWHGNRESIRRSFFSKESILVWVATTYHRRQREFGALRASGAHPHLSWVEFRHPAHASRWLASLIRWRQR